MTDSSEDAPLLITCEEGEDLDEIDRFINQVQAERRNRQEHQFQKNNLHLDIPPIPAGKSHHVFISHCNQSEEEESWAKHLVKNLEHDCGLKCVLPQRDFIPGQSVATQIQGGILGAMKVLIVLSPDSVQSRWCKYEIELAFGQSIDSPENHIVPILLSPCEVPDLLKTMNYIDVPKGEDYIFRIRRCFDEDSRDMAMVNPVVRPFNKNTDEPESGNHVEMSASRNLKHICRGPSWSFRDLTRHERYMLRQAAGKFSEKVYFDVRNMANNATALRFYSVAYSPKHCCPLLCAIVVILTFMMTLGINLVEIITGEMILMSIYVFLLLLCGSCCGVLCSMVGFNVRNSTKLEKQLIAYSLDNVFQTKILVGYFDGMNEQPKLVLAYYDFKPCLEYLARIMADANIETEELGMQRAKEYMFSLARDNYKLLVRGKLPMSVVHRHPTFLRQKCLCEFAQDKLWKREVV